jgi:transketolase
MLIAYCLKPIAKKMKKYTNTGSKDTRSGFGAGMTEFGQKNENVVAFVPT